MAENEWSVPRGTLRNTCPSDRNGIEVNRVQEPPAKESAVPGLPAFHFFPRIVRAAVYSVAAARGFLGISLHFGGNFGHLSVMGKRDPRGLYDTYCNGHERKGFYMTFTVMGLNETGFPVCRVIKSGNDVIEGIDHIAANVLHA